MWDRAESPLRKVGWEGDEGTKATGVVRRIDRLGRIVLPVELRVQLGINENTLMEIYRDDRFIILTRHILTKHKKGCVFCGATEELTECRGKLVCRSCMAEIAQVSGRE